MSFAATVESAPARLAPLNSFSGASLPPLSTGHVGMPTNIDERLVVRNASVIAPLFATPPEAYVTAPLRRPCVVERTELSLPETQTSIASDILNRGKRATRHYTKKTLGALPLFCTLAAAVGERARRATPSLPLASLGSPLFLHPASLPPPLPPYLRNACARAQG